MRHESIKKAETVAIVGAGWNGSHIAVSLSKRGYRVTLFERNADIFSGVSGDFGIRIHVGPHYPRSRATRNACRAGFNNFCLAYPELVVPHRFSIYAIGKEDADERPPKVSESEFRRVCKEFNYKAEINLENQGLDKSTILAAFNLDEPSAVLNPRLRQVFKERLAEANVEVVCSFAISKIEVEKGGYTVSGQKGSFKFDHVINTSSYKDLFPTASLPFSIKPIYQICLALMYEDTQPEKDGRAISFIVMDGAFPCLMPYDNRETAQGPITNYIMTHGKWTIVGTYGSTQEAEHYLSQIDDRFIEENVKFRCEKHMKSFWPEFGSRFRFKKWIGTVLAKADTKTEFRGTIVFQDPNQVAHVFPGKITNIFDAEEEVAKLIQGRELRCTNEGYRYVVGGVLESASAELSVYGDERSTSRLQTYKTELEERFPFSSQQSISNISLISKIFFLIALLANASFSCKESVTRFALAIMIVVASAGTMLYYADTDVNEFKAFVPS